MPFANLVFENFEDKSLMISVISCAVFAAELPAAANVSPAPAFTLAALLPTALPIAATVLPAPVLAIQRPVSPNSLAA